MTTTFTEPNVKIVGPYGYQTAQQWEERTYALPSGEKVRARAERLTPVAHWWQDIRVSTPAGRWVIERRRISGSRVRVEIVQLEGPRS